MDILSFHKLLSDETRLKVLLIMASVNEPLCVCDLMEAMSLSQPKISRHLALLRKHQMVIATKKGKWVHYEINPELPDWAQWILREHVSKHQSFFSEEFTKITKFNQEL